MTTVYNFKNLLNIQIVRFTIIGILSTLIHSTVYIILLHFLALDPQYSNVIGFSVALIFSYLGQRFWTFEYIQMKSEKTSQIKFLISAFLSYAMNSLWVFVVEECLFISSSYAIIGFIFITPVLAFMTLKLWVFKNA